MGPVFLFVAMIIHSFFEGLPIGFAKDNRAAFKFMTAVGMHKFAEAFFMGTILLKAVNNGFPKLSLTLSVLLSIGTPSGIMGGVFMSNLAIGDLEVTALALAAGTFIYIGATEIPMEEFEDEHHEEKTGSLLEK